MRTIWFIRHAESDANVGLPSVYPAAPVLTERGMAQAQQVIGAITTKPDLVVVSPYRRTHLTAEPLLKRFPDLPLETWPVQEFTYLDLPPDIPSTYDDRRPMIEAYWQRYDPWYLDGPSAESFAMLLERTQAAVTTWRNRTEPFTLLFSHSVFMRALLWQQIAPPRTLSSEQMRRFRTFITAVHIPNTAIIKLLDDGHDLWVSGIQTSHLGNAPGSETRSPAHT